MDKVPCVWKDGKEQAPHHMGKTPLYCHVQREHAALHAMMNIESGGEYWCDRDHKSAFNWRLGKVMLMSCHLAQRAVLCVCVCE